MSGAAGIGSLTEICAYALILTELAFRRSFSSSQLPQFVTRKKISGGQGARKQFSFCLQKREIAV
jgi:hypothetical protein